MLKQNIVFKSIEKNILLFLIYPIAILSSCSEPTAPDYKIEGNYWVLKQELSLSTNTIRNYDYEIDDYYSAILLRISENKISKFLNNYSDSAYSEYSFSFIKNKDSLIFENENDLFKTRIIYYYKGYQLFETVIIDDIEEANNIYERYEENIPPLSWTTILKQDIWEPDNNASTATEIYVGKPIQTHTITLNDIDIYKFSGLAGKQYLILVMGNMESILRIGYIENEYILWGSDDINNDDKLPIDGNVDSALLWECKYSGEYYIGIQASEHWRNTGYYTISLSESNP